MDTATTNKHLLPTAVPVGVVAGSSSFDSLLAPAGSVPARVRTH